MKETTTLRFIVLFLKTQKAHVWHCILSEEKMAVKEINIPVATQIPILIKILSQCSSILRLAEDTMFTKMCGFSLFAMTC